MKILIVATHHNIFSQKIGAQHRIYNMAQQLENKGNEIVVLQPDRFQVETPNFKCYYFKEHNIPFLKSIGWEYLPLLTDLNFNFIFKMRNLLKTEDIDLVQIEYPWGVIAAKILKKLLNRSFVVVFDSHDVEYRLIKQFINNVISKRSKLLRYLMFPGLMYIYLQERIASKCADHILTVSEDDKKCFAKMYNINVEKLTVIPSGINLKNLKSIKPKELVKKQFKIPEEKVLIIFHGAYSHFPNREAIEKIEDYLAPNLKELIFLIAGTGVPEYIKNNIYSVGFVKDLESFLHIADIAIVPLTSGGGTKIKILDYLNIGLPIVSTKKGMEGIEVKNKEHAIVVNNIDENFISAIKCLAKNKDKREEIGYNSFKLAKELYDWEKIGRKLNKLYLSLRGLNYEKI